VVNCPTIIKPNWRAKRYGFLCGEKEAPITRCCSETISAFYISQFLPLHGPVRRKVMSARC